MSFRTNSVFKVWNRLIRRHKPIITPNNNGVYRAKEQAAAQKEAQQRVPFESPPPITRGGASINQHNIKSLTLKDEKEFTEDTPFALKQPPNHNGSQHTKKKKDIQESNKEDYFISCDKVEELLDAALLEAKQADRDKLEDLKKEMNERIEELLTNRIEDPAKLPTIWKNDLS